MTDQEILKQARILYPSGTKYIGLGLEENASCRANSNAGNIINVSRRMMIDNYMEMTRIYDYSSNAYIYDNGTWVTIVYSPTPGYVLF